MIARVRRCIWWDALGAPAVLAAFLLLTTPKAWAFDPSTTWQTLRSAGVRVHFPQGRYETALKVARFAEQALDELSEALGWRPEETLDIVLNDETDTANGAATVHPYNAMWLNMVAPDDLSSLSSYRDWAHGLVTHEVAHIVHLSTIRGLPRVINYVFGRLLVPNGNQPQWLVEGLATYFESELTGRGRINSAYFDMMLRSDLLERGPFSMALLSGTSRQWPQGTLAYLYGGYFVDYFSRRFGQDAIRVMSYDYSARVIPFAVNLSAERATGHSLDELYDDFIAELRDRYQDQAQAIRKAGMIEGELLTHRGQRVGPARVAVDGTVYFVESPAGGHAELRARTPDGQERVVCRVHPSTGLALIADTKKALLAQRDIHDTYRFYGDLFVVDLEQGDTTRLTEGARARDPDVAADGQWFVFVQNDGFHSVVRRASFADPTAVKTVVDLGPDSQVWSPRITKDGSEVVFVGFRDGHRDLYRVSASGGEPQKLTNDGALEGGPALSADGEHVLYHSDLDGVFNLYALALAGGPARRLTRVLGGAVNPTVCPDGRCVVYQSYSANGFDLARLPVGRLSDLQTVEPRAEEPSEVMPKSKSKSKSTMRIYPAQGYSPGPTLWPRTWLPVVSEDPFGPALGIAVGGQDVVGLHAYAGEVWVGLTSEVMGFHVGYANRQFHPGVGVSLSRSQQYAGMPYIRNGRSLSVLEDLWSGSIGVPLPLWVTRDASVRASLGYELSYRQILTPLTVHPLDRAPQFPAGGRFAAVRAGVTFSNVRGYVNSISPEEGLQLQLGLRLEDPYVGSEFSAISASARTHLYLENPWIERHVLATTFFVGHGKSSYRKRRLFQVGGLQQSDPLFELLFREPSASQGLRGFPREPFWGDFLAELHLEYRWPLWDVEQGIGALPFFLRTLHGAAFVDAAAIADTPRQAVDNQHYSIGAELRVGLLVGYYIPVTARIGYGRGLGSDRVQRFFFVLGGSF